MALSRLALKSFTGLHSSRHFINSFYVKPLSASFSAASGPFFNQKQKKFIKDNNMNIKKDLNINANKEIYKEIYKQIYQNQLPNNHKDFDNEYENNSSKKVLCLWGGFMLGATAIYFANKINTDNGKKQNIKDDTIIRGRQIQQQEFKEYKGVMKNYNPVMKNYNPVMENHKRVMESRERKERVIVDKFLSYIKDNNIDDVRKALVNSEGSIGIMSICYAIENGSYEMVRLLLDNYNDVCYTIFYEAISSNNAEIIKLVMSKYTPNINDIFDAISKQKNEVLKILIDSKKINLMDYRRGRMEDNYGDVLNNITAIEHAIDERNLGAVNMLLAAEPEFLNSKFSNGQSPLLRGVRSQETAGHMANIYLKNKDKLKGFNINETSPHGYGILYYLLAMNNCDKVFKDIIKEFKPDLNIKDKSGKPILMHAIDKNKISHTKFMIDNGADINITGQNGITPLLYAISKSNFDIVELLLNNDKLCLECNDMKRKIIESLNKIDGPNKNKIYEKIIKTRKFDVNARIDNYNETLLMKAARKGDVSLLKLLLENGADIKLVNITNDTARDIAKMNKNINCVELIDTFNSGWLW